MRRSLWELAPTALSKSCRRPPTAFSPKNAQTMYVNVIFTTRGQMRSGDIHPCEQLNHIVFGRVTLTQLVGELPVDAARRPAHRSAHRPPLPDTVPARRDAGMREINQTFSGGDVVRIPAHVPHLYSYEVRCGRHELASVTPRSAKATATSVAC